MPIIYDLINSNDYHGLKSYLESDKNKLELFVSKSVDKNNEKLTPLQFSALKNKFEAMKVIIEMGGNPFAQSKVKLSTPLHYVVSHMNYEAVVLLLDSLRDDEKKSLIKMKDRLGKTVLHYLIENFEMNPEVAILIYDKLLASIPKNYRSKFLTEQNKMGESAIFTLVLRASKEDKATDKLIEKFVGELVDLKLDQLNCTLHSVLSCLPLSGLSDMAKQRLIYAHSRQQSINASNKAKVAINSNPVSSSYSVVTQLSIKERIDRDSNEIAVCTWFDDYLAEKSKAHKDVNHEVKTLKSTEMDIPTLPSPRNEVEQRGKPQNQRSFTRSKKERVAQQATSSTSRLLANQLRTGFVLARKTSSSVKHTQPQRVMGTASTAVAPQPRAEHVAMRTTSPSVNVLA